MSFGRRYASLATTGLGLLGWRVGRSAAAGASLDGQVALVTGGSRGLGLLIARELAANGRRIALVARDADELERARADLRTREVEALAVACDVGDQGQVDRAIESVMDRFTRIDILVNNAGLITVRPLASMRLEDFGEALAVMYWGMVYPTLAVLESMRRRGSGRIVNITSIGGKVSVPHLLPYSSARSRQSASQRGSAPSWLAPTSASPPWCPANVESPPRRAGRSAERAQRGSRGSRTAGATAD